MPDADIFLVHILSLNGLGYQLTKGEWPIYPLLNYAVVDSNISLSPVWCQTIIWTSDGSLLTGSLAQLAVSFESKYKHFDEENQIKNVCFGLNVSTIALIWITKCNSMWFDCSNAINCIGFVYWKENAFTKQMTICILWLFNVSCSTKRVPLKSWHRAVNM